MAGFDYFRTFRERYQPRTAMSALKALGEGLVEQEAYIHLGVSIKPADDEPVDLDEIERILSRDDLDLETNLLLVKILEKLVKERDPETALFAAESINLIENRYNRRIEELKSSFKKTGDVSFLSRLANQFFELSQIYTGSIRNFYLKEAYSCLARISGFSELVKEDKALLLRVLLELKQYDQAASILKKNEEREEYIFIMLEAELEFRRRNFYQVIHQCAGLFEFEEALDEGAKSILDYWLGD